MFFYRFEGHIENYSDEMNNFEYSRNIEESNDDFSRKFDGKIYVFISRIRNRNITMGAISLLDTDISSIFESFLESVEILTTNERISEITINGISSLLRISSRNSFIYSDSSVKDEYFIEDISRGYGNSIEYSEMMIENIHSKEEILKKCDNLFCDESLIPEIERIYGENNNPLAKGHPVHYIIYAEDNNINKKICSSLTSALYSNFRIKSKRVTMIDVDKTRNFSSNNIEAIFKISEDGTIIFNIGEDISDEEFEANEQEEKILSICKKVREYSNKIQIIFNFFKPCKKIIDNIYNNTENISFVEIKDESLMGDNIYEYIKIKAAENNVEADYDILEKYIEENKSYKVSELNRIFDKWYQKKLKTEVFPQYKEIISSDKKVVKEKPKGNAYDELMNMIGLKNVKETVNRIVKYYKAQALFKERGFKVGKNSMHMVFTGSPGTAKTTVARLLAQILKDNGILSRGYLYELGRADLVGKYVGWTAQIVKDAFKKAKGSVLFIDEAYSLLDSKGGSYGDEAINTIVQEMENNRDDLVVIFAGYPKEMEAFIERNTGLKSRIAYNIFFDDYTPNELYDITKLFAKKADMVFSEGVKEKLIPVFENAVRQKDFGNGRFSRNIFEKAKLNLANRIIEKDTDYLTDNDFKTFIPEDFVFEDISYVKEKNRIGF
ncbi:MAG: AAA family ATPase [Lachnospirales bacterium]